MKINQILEKASFYYAVAFISAVIDIFLAINIVKIPQHGIKTTFFVSLVGFLSAVANFYSIDIHKKCDESTALLMVFSFLIWFCCGFHVFVNAPGNFFLFYLFLVIFFCLYLSQKLLKNILKIPNRRTNFFNAHHGGLFYFKFYCRLFALFKGRNLIIPNLPTNKFFREFKFNWPSKKF